MSRQPTHPPLSQWQEAVVTAGLVPRPPQAVVPDGHVRDLVCRHEGDVIVALDRLLLPVKRAGQDSRSLLGAMAVVELDPPTSFGARWYSWYASAGGGHGSWHTSREDAFTALGSDLAGMHRFWQRYAACRAAGDLCGGQPVIRCDRQHYVLAPGGGDSFAGFGGRLFRFRLFGTGRIVESRNVWSQGTIPDEYAELLPDNAERVPA